jgi:hypothetical protein
MNTILLKRPMMFFLLVVSFLSCRVTLVPEYNAVLEQQISNAAQASDRIYIDMLDAAPPDRKYENFRERYNGIESEINSIQLKNEARKNNVDFLVICKNLKDAFAEAKKYHKDHNSLSDGEIKAYQASLAAFWKPLYVAERGLK